ncbi:MAG: hypothetical protein ACR2PU_01540 [Gammaproteobacteria bacterium]
MLSAKSIQRLYRPSRLLKLRAANSLQAFASKSKFQKDDTHDRSLSRDQVLEIYDWIAQLRTQ